MSNYTESSNKSLHYIVNYCVCKSYFPVQVLKYEICLGWLKGVPGEPNRAYCLYCDKSLHAHCLSLLKHTCTIKHTKAAQDASSKKVFFSFDCDYCIS